jgi:hypothetical protein
MLREYQEEIRALKMQLEATQRGVMIDENGKVFFLFFYLFIYFFYYLNF